MFYNIFYLFLNIKKDKKLNFRYQKNSEKTSISGNLSVKIFGR